jgi:hypothetical protein
MAVTSIREGRKMSRKTLWIIIGIIIAVAVASVLAWWVIHLPDWPDWTGFKGKTAWDLSELLIIPLVLAGGGLLFSRAERRAERAMAERREKIERELATERRLEDTLQAYLDKMTELILKNGLRKSKKGDAVRDIARARTLTVLRILDFGRNQTLIQFLREAQLFGRGDEDIIQLSHAALREADLRWADLSEANLVKNYLYGVKFRSANLTGAKLVAANLTEANLAQANLSRANLSRAILWGANLSQALLFEANLEEARYNAAPYTDEWRTYQPTIWPDGFDPIAAGAILEE